VSSFVLVDCTAYIAGHDFTTDSNSLTLSMEVDEQDNTTFGGGGWRSRVGGLKSASLSLEGFWQAGTGSVDADTFPTLGNPNEVVTVTPAGNEQEAAYMAQMTKFTYEIFGSVGEMAPFSLEAMSSEGASGLVRGQLAKAKGDVSATGAFGSAVNLGAGAAGKYLYLAFHVFTAGTTISVKVESDDAEAFSTPADVASATVGPITAAGGTWMTRVDASAITDSWFRLNATAATGTSNVAAALAIQ
jgi:hypothetical protein